jgi:beta-phosphoglucomutase-like phosphatase (HAD superfamily)
MLDTKQSERNGQAFVFHTWACSVATREQVTASARRCRTLQLQSRRLGVGSAPRQQLAPEARWGSHRCHLGFHKLLTRGARRLWVSASPLAPLQLRAATPAPENDPDASEAKTMPPRRASDSGSSSSSSSSSPRARERRFRNRDSADEADGDDADLEVNEVDDEDEELDAEQELLADITERYETWKSQAQRKSLSAMRGSEEVFFDAYDLNERFRPDYWQRLRVILQPEEAFANIFKLEGVLSANAHAIEYASWKQLAEELDKEPPDEDIVQQTYHLRPERIVQGVLRWTDSWREVLSIVYRQQEIYRERFLAEQHRPTRGLLRWLELLQRYDMPCAVYSRLDRVSVEKALTDMGVADFFKERITAESEVETAIQFLLVACVKMQRAPQKCVVYEDTPKGILAAHEVFSKAIGLVGLFPAFDLRLADLTVEDFDDLRVMNVRRLFADQEEPAPQFEYERRW